MKTIIFACDICEAEFPPKAYSFLTGQTISIDKELNMHTVPFEGHYCGECTELILNKIHEMRSAKQESGAKKMGEEK